MGRTLIFLLICSTLIFAGHKTRAPLPSKLLAAKTVYVENHAEARIADEAYKYLGKWGRLQVVESRDKADVVFILTVTRGQDISGTTTEFHPATDGTSEGAAHWTYGSIDASTPSYTNLHITDTHGQLLYSDSHRWSWHGATRTMIEDLRKRIDEQERPK